MTTQAAIIFGSVLITIPLVSIAVNLANLVHIYRFIHGNILRIADSLSKTNKKND